jgi:purine catabolism regulator
MESLANVALFQVRDLPARPGYALRVGELLDLPSLAGATVVAGAAGTSAPVRRVNVMEVPDILPWVKPHELLLTTGFPLRHAESGQSFDAEELVELVEALAEHGVAAMGVKSGRYLDELPPPVLAAADRLGFPVLSLPETVAFDEVISEVFAQLLDRQSRALDIADRLHQALTAIVLEGGDLPQIAAEVAALFDAAVLVCSPDGRLQTLAGAEEHTSALLALPLFDPSGRLYTERLTAGLQAVADGRPGQLAVAGVLAAGADHGRIVAYSPLGFAPVIVQALERAATVAALAITKQLAVSAVESKFRGDYLRDALAGNAGPEEQVVAHCAELGWDVLRPLVVVVAVLDDEPTVAPLAGRSPQERFNNAWLQVVRARDRAAPVVGFSHEVVALVPATAATASAVVAELIAAVAGDRGGGRRSFSAGVSRVVDSAAGLPVAYDQARKAVVVGRRMHGDGAVAHFDGLGVHRLLSLVDDSAELRSFATEVLGRLAEDSPETADLRRTLQTLLDTNCNVAETARALHFHYNTLRYRIGKLETIVGPFTTDANLRLDVALALRVVQMRGL